MTVIRGVLFDLDGTLVDTAPDITAAINFALADVALPAVTLREISERIGKGPRRLVERVLAKKDLQLDDAARERLVDPLLSAYLDHYAVVIGSYGRLFPQVAETLRALRARGLKIATVTNALQRPAEAILERYGIAPLIDFVLGGDRVTKRKPNPEPLEAACQHLGISTREALMVGDSANDVSAARAAGCGVVCVSYGYNEGQSVALLGCDVIDSFGSLPGLITARHTA